MRKRKNSQQCSGLDEVVKGKENGNKAIESGSGAASHLLQIQLWSVHVRTKPSFRKSFWKVLV